jgi:hypothetical protein
LLVMASPRRFELYRISSTWGLFNIADPTGRCHGLWNIQGRLATILWQCDSTYSMSFYFLQALTDFFPSLFLIWSHNIKSLGSGEG